MGFFLKKSEKKESEKGENLAISLIKESIEKDAEVREAILNDSRILTRLLQENLITEIKEELKIKKLVLTYDYETEKNKFLERYKSENTKGSYKKALERAEHYCRYSGLNSPIELKKSDVNTWARNLIKEGLSPSTVNLNLAAVSAFFTFLNAYNDRNELINPVAGCIERPRDKARRTAHFYSEGLTDEVLEAVRKDFHAIIDNEKNPELKAIMVIMLNSGLRCGAFEALKVTGNKFKTVTKGEEFEGTFNLVCLMAMDKAGVKRASPFPAWNPNRVKQAVKNHVASLYDKGMIRQKYSAHDFRHFFALSYYKRSKDIYGLKVLLGHSSVSITERYLRGLNVEC